MKSWQVAADLRPSTGVAAVLVALHGMAAALPWACRLDPGFAILLCIASWVLLTFSWRRLSGRGRVLGLSIEAGSVACRDTSGWWPATLDGRSRAWPGLVYLRLGTAAGPVEILLTRASLGATDFRRLKVLLRGRDSPAGAFC